MTQSRDAAQTAGSSAAGDEPDWRALYLKARRFAGAAADLDMDPEDLVQDAMESLTMHLADIDDPGAYLYTIIHNRVLDLRRRTGARRRRMQAVDLGIPDAALDDYAVELHAAIELLDPTDRAIVYLAVVEGRPSAEIADLLDLSGAAVRKRLSRARRRLARAHSEGHRRRSTPSTPRAMGSDRPEADVATESRRLCRR
ncbi:MAG: sigma-70 family RNA polymerase sigma factor [Acidimicrobiales bacterium]